MRLFTLIENEEEKIKLRRAIDVERAIVIKNEELIASIHDPLERRRLEDNLKAEKNRVKEYEERLRKLEQVDVEDRASMTTREVPTTSDRTEY